MSLRFLITRAALGFGLLFCAWSHQIRAEAVCAEVKIEFRDAAGIVVIGSTDPTNTSALFFIRPDGGSGVTGGSDGGGMVAGNSDAEVNWLIIPAPGAGGTVAQGQLYAVGARVS